jgi:hypothetical protein
MAHSTSEGCKYEKDGTYIKGFRQGQLHSALTYKKQGNTHDQFSAKMANLRKQTRILRK